ncbi:MAG: Maf family protein [Pseudomonadota bacterium]
MAGFILASQSPRRRDLLAQIGYTPSAIAPADIDETPQKSELPRPYAIRMAREKANVAARAHPGQIVLTGDTVVAAGRRILGKAETQSDACAMLALLSGRRHRVISAIAVSDGETLRERCVISAVKFKRLSHEEMQRYLASGEWQGKAGGYAIQGLAAAFIPWMQGSYSAIVGLPILEAQTLLRAAGVEPSS